VACARSEGVLNRGDGDDVVRRLALGRSALALDVDRLLARQPYEADQEQRADDGASGRAGRGARGGALGRDSRRAGRVGLNVNLKGALGNAERVESGLLGVRAVGAVGAVAA
jgi:hypothetical protein